MGPTPDELRHDADQTRTHLARTTDQLVDKVSPPRIARRRAESGRRRLGAVRDRVMGGAQHSTSQIGDTMRGGTEQLSQKAQQAPAQIRSQTQGSPFAAGLIAFGTGMLAGALLPASSAEERVGRQIRDHADELVQPAKEAALDSAQQVREEMREPLKEATESVKGTAREAATATKEQGQQSGQEGAQQLRETGQQTAEQARRQTRAP
ncbi:MAG TPA: DUF3618 domain-containing protein [Streptomyces sp.]|nr:DUF3618 domain-containing protein [Streptomyces sp.]